VASGSASVFREYAAMQFYRMDCRNKSIPVRWGCLREDLREKYLATADAAVKAWADEEEAACQRREEGNPRAFFSEPNIQAEPRPSKS